jgi:hypothetical protein
MFASSIGTARPAFSAADEALRTAGAVSLRMARHG